MLGDVPANNSAVIKPKKIIDENVSGKNFEGKLADKNLDKVSPAKSKEKPRKKGKKNVRKVNSMQEGVNSFKTDSTDSVVLVGQASSSLLRINMMRKQNTE